MSVSVRCLFYGAGWLTDSLRRAPVEGDDGSALPLLPLLLQVQSQPEVRHLRPQHVVQQHVPGYGKNLLKTKNSSRIGPISRKLL